ncbi:F0F1 ATP synthase subunit delta [soil metagenome]
MAVTRNAARRYAEAAFEIARRDESMDAWLAALALAEERLVEPQAMRLLAHPTVAVSRRVELLGRILGQDVPAAPRNLLALLVRRGRFELLPAVVREFRRLHARQEGIVEASVTSAVALDEAAQTALQERLSVLTGQRVEMHLDVDPSLLGGVSVRIGDRLIDGSVRGRLERLRATFSSTAT